MILHPSHLIFKYQFTPIKIKDKESEISVDKFNKKNVRHV